MLCIEAYHREYYGIMRMRSSSSAVYSVLYINTEDYTAYIPNPSFVWSNFSLPFIHYVRRNVTVL